MRLPVNRLLPLAAPFFLAGCLGGGGDDLRSAPVVTPNGPEADYPVVVGEPFTIGSTTYAPEDRLNYDAVGYAMVGEGDGTKVAASHKTLPLPSYIEVTELENGRTALVRVETRGPMQNDKLIELTPAAAAQLGITAATVPVRIRRVNPAEAERALLRAGEPAPLRIDTPRPLVAVLKRKLDSEQPSPTAAELTPTPTPAPAIVAVDPDPQEVQPVSASEAPAPKPEPVVQPTAEATPKTEPVVQPTPQPETAKPKTPPAPAAAQTGNRAVQVGTFSTRERAETAAKPLGGTITPSGKFWVVRMGPFKSAGDAAAALEKARKSGYKDAVVRRID